MQPLLPSLVALLNKSRLKPNPPQQSMQQSSSSSNLPSSYSIPPWSGTPLSKEWCFEVIKGGTRVELTPPLTKAATVVGKLPTCDIQLDHPSISRYHAILQFSRQGQLFLYDFSTHGCFVNKKPIQRHQFTLLHAGDFVQFGGSSRVLILQGPSSLNTPAEDEDFSVGDETDASRKTTAPALKSLQASHHRSSGSTHHTAGVADNEEEEYEIPQSMAKADPSFYQEDPKKAIRTFCHREGIPLPDIDITKDELSNDLFIAKATLYVEGTSVIGSGSGIGKRAAELEAYMDLCATLDEQGLLQPIVDEMGAGNRRVLKRKLKLDREEDGGGDSFIDEVAASALKSTITRSHQVQTLDTLLAQRTAILTRIDLLQQETLALPSIAAPSTGGVNNDEEEDELDKVLFNLQQKERQVEITKIAKQVAVLREELKHVEGVLSVVAPNLRLDDLPTNEKSRAPSMSVKASTLMISDPQTGENVAARSVSPSKACVPGPKSSPGPTLASPMAEASAPENAAPSEPKKKAVKVYQATPLAQVERDRRVEGDEGVLDWVASSERLPSDAIQKQNASYGY